MPTDPTRTVGRRVGAYLLDSLLYAVLAAALWFALTDRLPASQTDSSGGGFKIGNTRYGFTSDHAGKRTAWFVAVALIAILLFVVLPGLRGKSPGKYLTKITIVRPDGRPPGIGRQILRQLLWVVDGIAGGLVAFVTALASKRHQRVGDMVAKTYVVRDEAAGRPLAAMPSPPPAAMPPPPPPPPA